MAAKITFNPATRRVEVTLAPDANGLIVLNVKEDLYSDGKEDWLADATLNKMRFPVQPIGGNPIPLGVVGDSYILENGWKIAPYEADHTLRIVGNLFAAEEPLVVDTVGNYRVRVQEQVSTLVEVREIYEQALTDMRKLFFNAFETNPNTGKMTVYDDDGTTVFVEGDIWEDIAKTQAYRGQGIERRDPLG